MFENRPDFWEPDDQVNRIYDQLAQNRCREIPSDHLKYVCSQNKILHFYVMFQQCSITSEIGSGEFGIVSRASWQLQIGGKREVAVKQLRQGASNEERAKFLQEGARMMQFFHTNVVKLQGMVTIGDTVSFRGTVRNLQYGSQYTPSHALWRLHEYTDTQLELDSIQVFHVLHLFYTTSLEIFGDFERCYAHHKRLVRHTCLNACLSVF